jgi:hypothetical protein
MLDVPQSKLGEAQYQSKATPVPNFVLTGTRVRMDSPALGGFPGTHRVQRLERYHQGCYGRQKCVL